MAPKQRQKIEIEKTHRDPLLSFNQAVTVDCSDFLGTALVVSQNAILRGDGVSGAFALSTTHGKDSQISNPCGVRERIRGVTRLPTKGVNPRASKSTTQTFSGVHQFYEGNRGKPRLKLRLPRWGI